MNTAMIAAPEPRDRMTEDGAFWYALQVAPGALALRHPVPMRERANVYRPLGFPIEEIMHRRGLEPFIPSENLWIRANKFRKHEKRRVRRAILPGMVFLKVRHPVPWAALCAIPMVTGIFGIYGSPYPFHPTGIARLAAISATLYQPERARPMPTRRTYEVGDDVLDLLGRFEGVPLKVVDISGERAKVLGKLFGSEFEMSANVSDLAKWA
jgi:transcription antitermination factor NusG